MEERCGDAVNPEQNKQRMTMRAVTVRSSSSSRTTPATTAGGAPSDSLPASYSSTSSPDAMVRMGRNPRERLGLGLGAHSGA
jgi:hypothetical protein